MSDESHENPGTPGTKLKVFRNNEPRRTVTLGEPHIFPDYFRVEPALFLMVKVVKKRVCSTGLKGKPALNTHDENCTAGR